MKDSGLYEPPYAKAAELFSRLLNIPTAERLDLILGSKGHELAALLRYVEGVQRVGTTDELMGLILVVAGERYLKRAAKKHAKRKKRAKRIF